MAARGLGSTEVKILAAYMSFLPIMEALPILSKLYLFLS